MPELAIEAPVNDGVAIGRITVPEGAGPFPLVVWFPDAGGLRPAMSAMAARLAGHGYAVLQVDPFWRSEPYARFDLATVFSDPAERARLMALIYSVKSDAVMADVDALIAAITDPRVRTERVGATGYCMGGRLAFVLATARPERVVSVAAFHAGGLVSDKPDSPHLAAERLRARVYLGVAADDASCTPAHQQALDVALASVEHVIEGYAARHGFAVTDFPVYDELAAERHWERMLGWFAPLRA